MRARNSSSIATPAAVDAPRSSLPIAVRAASSLAGVPPDEVLTGEVGDKLGVFGFPPTFPLQWSESSRPAPGGVESLALGDLVEALAGAARVAKRT